LDGPKSGDASPELVYFSNMLLLVSYSVRDILWLRWFAVENREQLKFGCDAVNLQFPIGH
jgi:hypothetical protein